MPGPAIVKLQELTTGLRASFGRFPLPLASAAAWCTVTIAKEHALGPEVAPGLLVQLQILGFLSFFLFLAITLFAERRRISAGRTLLLSAAGFVLLAALILSAPGRFEPDNPMVLLLGPGLVLLIMVAPFLAAKVENAAFWDFNRAGWLGAALGFLAALIVNLGLVFAIGAIEELFGLDMPSEIYGDTMTLCYGLIWPWLALGAVPRSFESPEGDYCPRWISFIIGNILVPLVVVYLAILYAFMAKILIQWQLPRGQVAYFVSGYATFGVATHLLAYPLQETGNRLVRLYHRHFYHALFLPIVLLGLAVGARVAGYGMTESRYALALFALWLAALALAFTLRPGLSRALVPLSLSVLLVLASFGPWGAAGVSTSSQLGRLEALLDANGLLVDGTITPTSAAIDFAQQKRISSVVAYLRKDSAKLDVLRVWLADKGLDLTIEGDRDKYKIMTALGLQFVEQWQDRPGFTYNAPRASELDVAGFDVLGWVTLPRIPTQELTAEGSGASYNVAFDKEAATVTVNDSRGQKLSFEILPLLERLSLEYPGRHDKETRALMSLEMITGTLRARLRFESLHGEVANGVRRVTYASGTILLGHTEAPE